ncbi:efflux RND transporter periplasmic adaptor subunit [Rhizobium rhizophilum]|jgi:multidrug efflux system membrane fusion protein|uniref:Efflux RND transporter periplasmic adaptor subunit n=1 Tax=Rhizobium rhizophilum TaxID=1850373 RepID=A0ABY2R0D3_9HYPH|nr:efflux RND transporter periplasmic adaptor subunit [Rhizobium rhizophilum]THV17087.1 efflux RND transporter periplasmic adaptor subunit [Rhizobium rhizophilum]
MSANFRVSMLSLPFLLTLGLAGCSEGGAEVVKEPALRPVKVIEVEAPSTDRELKYSGTVKARSEAAAGFRVAGKIIERLVDIGDRVAPGDVLARLDVTDYQLQMRSAEASLAAAERQLETADFALKRADALYRQQVTTKAQLEQAQLTYNQALATRDSQRSSLEQARNQVGYGELKADKTGIVTAISADAGQVVAAGSPVVTVAADGEKEVLIAVPENEIFAFAPGKEVDVGFWSTDGLASKGAVREVAGSADATSRTFAVRISLPDNPQILLGMTARVTALAPSDKDFFELPLSALTQDAAKQPTVWTVDRTDATVHARPVTVDTFSDTGVQVSAGLKPGDLVVVAGTQFMAEDMKVRLADKDLSRAAEADSGAVTPSAATR